MWYRYRKKVYYSNSSRSRDDSEQKKKQRVPGVFSPAIDFT